jgi:hypothetical protein
MALRTATSAPLLLIQVLIDKSGYQLAPRDNENIEQALEDIILASANHDASLADLMEWFRVRVIRPHV